MGGDSTATLGRAYLDPEQVAALLGPRGPLARCLRGFEVRPQQLDMLRNVVDAYNEDQLALVEAGTGTGKSMAYLLPALLWAAEHQETTVISTKTITLQEQLIRKDIPFLKQTLGLDVTAVLVKGMGNYLCKRKLEDAQEEVSFLSPDEERDLLRIVEWNDQSKDGSRSSLRFFPHPEVWERVRSEADQCSGARCNHYEDCFFFKARQYASKAKILVVNHALLCADLAARIETENYNQPCILPPYQRVVIDEAHHLEDVATEYFASRVSQRTLTKLLNLLTAEGGRVSAGKLNQLMERVHQSFPNETPSLVKRILQRLTIDIPAERGQLSKPIGVAFETLANFMVHAVGLTFGEGEGPGDQRLRIREQHRQLPFWKERVQTAVQSLTELGQRFVVSVRGILHDIDQTGDEKLVERTASLKLDVNALANRLETLFNDFRAFTEAEEEGEEVRWAETFTRGRHQDARAIRARLDIDTTLARHFFSKFRSVVLCSATLSTNRDFRFIRQRLGLREKLLPHRVITEHIYDSPFNYQEQALLCVPTDLPAPKDPKFLDAALDVILQALKASHGNAFVLFTSYQMLNNAYNKLKPLLEKRRMQLFRQGEDTRGNLLDRFAKTDRSVLFGTDSFWEGVDVAGESLRCVILVKLPFQVPSEPIVEARTEFLTQRGSDPFIHYAVPNAIVKFKQGFGRLIRSGSDRGCIVCLDNRLVLSRGYGQMFLRSLPKSRRFFGDSKAMVSAMKQFYRDTYRIVKGNGA